MRGIKGGKHPSPADKLSYLQSLCVCKLGHTSKECKTITSPPTCDTCKALKKCDYQTGDELSPAHKFVEQKLH